MANPFDPGTPQANWYDSLPETNQDGMVGKNWVDYSVARGGLKNFSQSLPNMTQYQNWAAKNVYTFGKDQNVDFQKAIEGKVSWSDFKNQYPNAIPDLSKDPTKVFNPESGQWIDKGPDTNALATMVSIASSALLPGIGSAISAALEVPTAVGTAIASTAVQVAQGVPIDKAIMNAAISNVVQTGSTDVAKTIVAAGNDPAVANAIASVGGSIAKTAASGGSSTDILNNAVGALAGSGVTSLTAEELGTVASRAVGAAVGTAAAGGDTTKVLGAAVGALSNDAAKKSDQKVADLVQQDQTPSLKTENSFAGNLPVSAEAENVISAIDAIKPDQLAFAGAVPALGSAAAAETAALLQRLAATPQGQAALREAATVSTKVRDIIIASGVFGAAGGAAFLQGASIVPPKIETTTPVTQPSLVDQIPGYNPPGTTVSTPALTPSASSTSASAPTTPNITPLEDLTKTGYTPPESSILPEDKPIIDLINKPVTPSAESPATTDTSTGTSSVSAPGTQEVVITAPAGEASNVATSDQQILNLIGADKTATGEANVAVISPDVVGTTGADANVAPVIVDTSSKPLIDTTTSLANAAGQVSDTVTITPEKPAANVATSDQQIIDLISGDTSRTVDTGGGVGTISTGGGAANVATGGAGGEIAATDTRTGAGTDTAASTATGAGADTKTTATTGTDVGTRAGTDVASDIGAKTEITGTEVAVEPAPVEQLPETETETAPAEKTAPAEEEVAKETVPYKPELFIFGGTAPKGRKSSSLSQTINAPFYPSTGLTQALTASRPAGEIEADPSGKKRQNVWNEASLRLKDALGL